MSPDYVVFYGKPVQPCLTRGGFAIGTGPIFLLAGGNKHPVILFPEPQADTARSRQKLERGTSGVILKAVTHRLKIGHHVGIPVGE